ncbi:hypothetical protein A5699_03405 [Mycobacterium sp. E802]|nr:hypothetical protein A5699_03405 [Mycobacterium sp. E802]
MFEAAKLTGLPVRTLRYRREHDLAPPSYRLGARVMYDVRDLDEWMDSQKAQTLRGGKAVDA